MDNHLEVLLEEKNQGFQVLSPVVGLVRLSVSAGMILQPGARIGRLRQLNQVYRLMLPPEACGRVVMEETEDHEWAVQFGETLFLLDPRVSAIEGEVRKKGKKRPDRRLRDGFVVQAFTTGIFYRRPAPDAAPFVAVGDRIEKGKILGLIEVMKSFNQVLFGGSGEPEKGIITEILVEDAQEVKEGDPLFVVGKEGEK